MTPIYFDLETTGLDEERHAIAMIGAATEDLESTFEVLVEVDEETADPEALDLGWYDAERWKKEAVSLHVALVRFDEWLTSVEPNPWSRKLVGHFAAEFDKKFLLAAYAKVGRKFPADFRVRDTMQLAIWLLPHRRSYKLGDLARDICGLEVRKSDGAPGDVRATIAVVEELRKKFGREAVAADESEAPERAVDSEESV